MYEWVKAMHVISIIAWMAGLLYLPRLMVYHSVCEIGSETSETFKTMERKLYRFIMNPAIVAAWIFGLWLAILIEPWKDIWFYTKLVLAVAMTVFHMLCGKWVAELAMDERNRGQRFYRFINEVPTLLMVGIVILVIVRPF